MHKVLLLTLCISLLTSSFTLAEEFKPVESKTITKNKAAQKYFVKEICSKNSLEKTINDWISENIDVEIESVNYAKIKRKQCAIVLYEK